MTDGAALHQHWLLTVPIRQQGFIAAVWALFVFAVGVYWMGVAASLVLALAAAVAVYLGVVRPLSRYHSITVGASNLDYWQVHSRDGQKELWVPHHVAHTPFCIVLRGGPLKGQSRRLYLWRWTLSTVLWQQLHRHTQDMP